MLEMGLMPVFPALEFLKLNSFIHSKMLSALITLLTAVVKVGQHKLEVKGLFHDFIGHSVLL